MAVKNVFNNVLLLDQCVETFHLIGAYDTIDSSKLCLVNRRYKQSRTFSCLSRSLPMLQQKNVYPKFDTHVSCVRKLKICLVRTANSTLPVLKELQVWGQPSYDCTNDVKEQTLNTELLVIRDRNRNDNEEAVGSAPTQIEKVQAQNNCICKDDEIPDEFLDSITYEVMSQPVLLPSGHNVDSFTLEKCKKASLELGNIYCDPFTGIPFDKNYVPVSNIELKLRMDNFWLSHPDIPSGGRCIGCSKPTAVRLKMLPRVYKKNHFAPYDVGFSSKNEKRRFAKNSWETTGNDSLSKIKTENMCWVKSEDNDEHSRELSSSLKTSLKQVLQGRLSYIRPSETVKLEESEKCCICSVVIECRIYQLPCSHKLCRNCLVKETKSLNTVCKTCSIRYKSHEVQCIYK